MSNTKSICVFCGSRDGADPAYIECAQTFGTQMAKRNWRLVFGAGDRGMMGAVADQVKTGGGDALGVIPEHLIGWEARNQSLGGAVITDNMHSRKKLMFVNSDAVVILPGGAGSLDEFFEVLTWAQLGLHEKPMVLVNVKGYWDPLVALIDHVIDQGFADASLKKYFTVAANTAETLDVLDKALG
ncbi:MAG: LOG family protein [Planktomarina sp.]